MKKGNNQKNQKEKNNRKKSKSKNKTKDIKKSGKNNEKEKKEYIFSLLNIRPEKEPDEIEEKNKTYTVSQNEEKINTSENKDKKEESNEDSKNMLDEYINAINAYLNEEKSNLIKEEETIEVDIKNKKSKKVNTIEVEENKNQYIEQFLPNKNNIIEVKDKIFKLDEDIPKEINYEGKLFVKDRHQGKLNNKEINYRCKHNRKEERIRTTAFCKALVKRKIDKKNVYYILETSHSKECNDLYLVNIKNETNLIGNYNDFINKCFAFLDSTETYNKKEFSNKLLGIYNENKYNFKLKENTIKNIIGRWKQISLRFTKYNAIENKINKNGELILWDYTNTVIYTSNKKNPLSCEYFVWTTDPIIARIRHSNHLFIDATFHHPQGYSQLLIIIFKDIITKEYYPGFYILMTNKTEILYDLIFKSVKRIITQQNIYSLNILTITTDTEIALINAVNNNFPHVTRIGCWFHLNQDLIREAKIMGLFNSKNKEIDANITYEIITQISLLPLNYKGNIEYLKNQLNIILLQYPKYYNYIVNYFISNKLRYFQDGTYDYSKFPPDIRSNSILERYNKLVKIELGEKRTCNWVIFMQFINKELSRINELLAKNSNINVIYKQKTKFGVNKYNYQENNENTLSLIEPDKIKKNITQEWLKQKINNCRYNAFITLFYFNFSSFISDNDEKNSIQLKEINNLIIKLTEEVNDKNYNDIIIYLQKNKFDTNNYIIDSIINEADEEKKLLLIDQMNKNNNIDTTSSGYINQLFSIFNNNDNFCFKESKSSECILCGKKTNEYITEMRPFLYINNTNINETHIFNILLNKCKEKYTYDCECRKNSLEDLLCTKVKYNIESYPNYLIVLFDMAYSELEKYKDNIFKLTEDKLILNFQKEYKLKGMISLPSSDHYICIIFNPIGRNINEYFKANNIYYHDGKKNNGKIEMINSGDDWKKLGIPYILVYELIKC